MIDNNEKLQSIGLFMIKIVEQNYDFPYLCDL